MNLDNDNWDRLMSRRLDGVAGEDEVLELDRELIRNPALRVRWDELQRIDAAAAEALVGVSSDRTESVAAARAIADRATCAEAPRIRWRSRMHRGWLFVPGAIAAALAAMVIPRIELGPSRSRGPIVAQVPGPAGSRDALHPSVLEPSGRASTALDWGARSLRDSGVPGDLMHTVGTTRRSTGRDVLGIVGDDGSIYFIEVDRTRTIRQPSAGANPNESERM